MSVPACAARSKTVTTSSNWIDVDLDALLFWALIRPASLNGWILSSDQKSR